jgi:hypothetical protein
MNIYPCRLPHVSIADDVRPLPEQKSQLLFWGSGPTIRGMGVSAMAPVGPFAKSLAISAVVLLAAAAFAQAPPKYDPATEGKFKGVVEELKFVPPSGGKPTAYLVIKSGADTLQVFLCPKAFLDQMGAIFKPEDKVEVTGSKVTQDGAELILAREVDKGEDMLTLRFKDGKPAW